MNKIRSLKLSSLVLISFLFTGCENKMEKIEINDVISIEEDVKELNLKEELEDSPVFTKSEIPVHIKQKMLGNSMPEDATISFDELSYLRVSHIDYNGKTQVGEMIVNNKLADEVLDIFRDIYIAGFPIEKIKLIDDYGASDHKSMIDNNSSAFCYRTIAGTSQVSNHGLGVAIDINPFYNPHVLKSKGTVDPPEASKYADRSLDEIGMIKRNDAVYEAFIIIYAPPEHPRDTVHQTKADAEADERYYN